VGGTLVYVDEHYGRAGVCQRPPVVGTAWKAVGTGCTDGDRRHSSGRGLPNHRQHRLAVSTDCCADGFTVGIVFQNFKFMFEKIFKLCFLKKKYF
jgi:hypothetical protein